MDAITVYEKPTCTTCRNLVTLLNDEGIDFDRVNYHVDTLTAAEIAALIAKTGLTPRDVLRKKEAAYKELVTPETTDAELITLMEQHPALLERPIVVRGDRAVLARPIEKVRELF
jgi:arsenate reductase